MKSVVSGKCYRLGVDTKWEFLFSAQWWLYRIFWIGWWLLKIISSLFSGITNDPKDPSIDVFTSGTLPLLKRFEVSTEGLQLKIENRGVVSKSGSEVTLPVPIIQKLQAMNWTDVRYGKKE